MNKLIIAKVAQILNQREIVINKGSNSGIQKGMKFKVLNSRGQNIIDPVTNESLGSLDLPKAEVKVTAVYEKMAICSTYKVLGSGFSGAFYGGLSQQLLNYASPKIETLNTDLDDIKEIDPQDSVVQIGDVAIQSSEFESEYFENAESAITAINGMYKNEQEYKGDWRPVYVQLDLFSAFEKAIRTLIRFTEDRESLKILEQSLDLISDAKRELRAEAFGFLDKKVSISDFEQMPDSEVSNLLRPERMGGALTRHIGLINTFEEELSKIKKLSGELFDK